MQRDMAATGDILTSVVGTPKPPVLVQQLPATPHPTSAQPSALPYPAGPRSTRTTSPSLSDPSSLSSVVSSHPSASTTSSSTAASTTSTAATSLGSSQTLHNCDGIFVQYERLPEETLKKLRDMWERLSHGWEHNDSSHIVHYVRAGTASKSLVPALLIEYGDQRRKKKLEEFLKKQKWLKREIRENSFDIFVIGGRFSMSASLVGDLPSNTLVLKGPTLLLPLEAQTLCGSAVLLPSQENAAPKFCTFGGLIIVHDRLFGLLARHPFHEGANTYEQRTGPILNTITDLDPNGVVQIQTSEPPFCLSYEDDFDDSDGSEDLCNFADTISGSQDDSDGHVLDEQSGREEEYMADMQILERPTADTDLLPLRIDLVVEQTPHTDGNSKALSRDDRDWALASLSDISSDDQQRVLLPNRVGDKLVESTFDNRDYTHGSVTLIPAGSGELEANLLGCPATVNVGKSRYETCLLSLEKPLRKYPPF
jgi:hypothetical protein